MHSFLSEIVGQKEIALGYREMTFLWPEEFGVPLPGQFLTIRVHTGISPLLRRPFAFSAYCKSSSASLSQTGRASIIYQIRGEGTRLMAAMKAGDTLDVLGPLGNSFTHPAGEERPVLAAGGIGLGPLLFLARDLDEAGKAPLLCYGCRNRDFIPDLPKLQGGRIVYCTDDGSEGFHGNVIEYLESLGSEEMAGGRIYACGPLPMLRGCHDFASRRKLYCETSLEEMMGCAVGACMGCVVELMDPDRPYARVCKEGPVFPSDTIKWNA